MGCNTILIFKLGLNGYSSHYLRARSFGHPN
jgi:hypothetical protein